MNVARLNNLPALKTHMLSHKGYTMAINIQLVGQHEVEECLLLHLALEEMDYQIHVFKTQSYIVQRHVLFVSNTMNVNL
jgi:hypothetical protein